MKGYVYLDNDHNLNIRNREFIEEEDPGFWGRNSHCIGIVWKFDTEDAQNMYQIMSSFKRHELQNRQVLDFCKNIGFDLPAFLAKRSPTLTSISTSTSSVANLGLPLDTSKTR